MSGYVDVVSDMTVTRSPQVSASSTHICPLIFILVPFRVELQSENRPHCGAKHA